MTFTLTLVSRYFFGKGKILKSGNKYFKNGGEIKESEIPKRVISSPIEKFMEIGGRVIQFDKRIIDGENGNITISVLIPSDRISIYYLDDIEELQFFYCGHEKFSSSTHGRETFLFSVDVSTLETCFMGEMMYHLNSFFCSSGIDVKYPFGIPNKINELFVSEFLLENPDFKSIEWLSGGCVNFYLTSPKKKYEIEIGNLTTVLSSLSGIKRFSKEVYSLFFFIDKERWLTHILDFENEFEFRRKS